MYSTCVLLVLVGVFQVPGGFVLADITSRNTLCQNIYLRDSHCPIAGKVVLPISNPWDSRSFLEIVPSGQKLLGRIWDGEVEYNVNNISAKAVLSLAFFVRPTSSYIMEKTLKRSTGSWAVHHYLPLRRVQGIIGASWMNRRCTLATIFLPIMNTLVFGQGLKCIARSLLVSLYMNTDAH